MEASKSGIKYLFRDLLNKSKGFKYQITVKLLLRKKKENWGIEFPPVYFNCATKTVINYKYILDKSFQEISHAIDNWINEESGWVIESVEAKYVNISVFSPLSGSTYIELPRRSKEISERFD